MPIKSSSTPLYIYPLLCTQKKSHSFTLLTGDKCFVGYDKISFYIYIYINNRGAYMINWTDGRLIILQCHFPIKNVYLMVSFSHSLS